MTLREQAAIKFEQLGEVRGTMGELWACSTTDEDDSEVLAAAVTTWVRKNGGLAQPVQLAEKLWGVLVLATTKPNE